MPILKVNVHHQSNRSTLKYITRLQTLEGARQLEHALKLTLGIKEAYRDQLPGNVINRPKSGMRVPVHFWFKDEMKRYARSILSKRAVKEAGIFDYERIKQLRNYDTEEGPGRYGLRLWMIITLEIWRRLVIDGEAI